MKANIKLSIPRLRPVGVLALMRNVLAKMTGNPNLPAPLADMGKLADDLETAIEEATNGSRASKLARDKVLAECTTALRAQASYVRGVCDGDAVKLAGSGYELMRRPSPIGIPGIAQRWKHASPVCRASWNCAGARYTGPMATRCG